MSSKKKFQRQKEGLTFSFIIKCESQNTEFVSHVSEIFRKLRIFSLPWIEFNQFNTHTHANSQIIPVILVWLPRTCNHCHFKKKIETDLIFFILLYPFLIHILMIILIIILTTTLHLYFIFRVFHVFRNKSLSCKSILNNTV